MISFTDHGSGQANTRYALQTSAKNIPGYFRSQLLIAMENMAHPDIWQEAQDRVLLYLKKLGMPAILSLEIAHQALRQAGEEASAAGTLGPTHLAMRALHKLLAANNDFLQQTTFGEYPILYRRWQPECPAGPAACTVKDSGTGLQAAALPPIDRKSMTIKKI